MRKWLAFGLLALAAPAFAASQQQIREAATRAVALMQSSQKEWDDAWACASCHHQYLPAITYRAAREHGIPVDETAAHADAEMAFRGLGNLDGAVQANHAIEPSIGDAYRLWAAEASGHPNNLAIQADIRVMAGHQFADGHWATMDQRPPQSYSPVTATALAIRSLRRYGHAGPESEARILQAAHWLSTNSPLDIEELAFSLLGLKWAAVPQLTGEGVKRVLLRIQNMDGGWGSLDRGPSDAYSTGEVLYALAENENNPMADPAWRRAIDFLVRTQQKDGSWHVHTRLHPPAPLSPEYFESGYPYEHDQYISIMGASWAVIALANSLPRVEHVSRALQQPPADPKWAATILFGAAGDLRHLLESGFDPNSATAEGTTALMMAVPDLAKVKLLVERGANVNATARSRFSALDVATQYRDAGPVVRLLLEKDAQVKSGSDLNAPHPMVLAAGSGNVEAIRALTQSGLSLEEPAILGSVLYATPLVLAAMKGDVETVTTLLDLGADINHPDREGLTPLTWATLANRYEVVRLLLDRHADPNLVDMYGMTALLYAASVDYGDARVLSALLQHGAQRGAKTKEGLTALGRARLFHHMRFVALLSP